MQRVRGKINASPAKTRNVRREYCPMEKRNSSIWRFFDQTRRLLRCVHRLSARKNRKAASPGRTHHQKSIIRTFLFERFLRVYKKTPTGINPCRCFFYFKYSAAEYPIYSLPPYSAMTQSHVYPFASVTASATIETFLPFGM